MEAIVAVYEDWGIGANGTQPLALSADRKYFRQMTKGACVIVGSRTLQDFPGGKPLPNRVNIVLSRRQDPVAGALLAHSPEQALALAQGKTMVIGGASVYEQMLPYCDTVYVTKVGTSPKSDVFFHNLDQDPQWICEDPGEEQWEGGISYRFCVYRRKR